MTDKATVMEILQQCNSYQSPHMIARATGGNRQEIAALMLAMTRDGELIRTTHGTYQLAGFIEREKRQPGVRVKRFPLVESKAAKIQLLGNLCNYLSEDKVALLQAVQEDLRRLDRYARGQSQ